MTPHTLKTITPKISTPKILTPKILTIGATLIALSACTSVALKTYPPLPYDTHPQYSVAVQSVTIKPPTNRQTLPNLPFSLNQNIRNWATHTLHATGTAGTATVIIKQADITFTPNTNEGNVIKRTASGTITMTVALDIQTKTPTHTNTLTATVTGRQETPRPITITQRDDLTYALMQRVINKIGKDLTTTMQTTPKTYTPK